jgi:hypothetical protein
VHGSECIYLLVEILLIESFVHTRSVVLTCRWRITKITRQVLLGGTTRARPGMLLLIPNHVWMFASLLHAEMNMIAAWFCGEGAG